MKKSIITLVACTFITGAILTSCNNSPKKAENAQTDAKEANNDLDKANEEYLADIEKYRKETADKIAANDKSIIEFKARIENEKNDAKVDYQKKITELEQKNSDIKKKMDDYKVEGKEKWEIFKVEFSRDMEELGKAFSNFFS